MDKYTKTVLKVIAVCFVVQINSKIIVASEINANKNGVAEAHFYEPSDDNKYVGRLFSSSESYPLSKMRKLCEPHTGLDTAQVKCQKIYSADGYICDFKCSKHWLVPKRD